jgi:hypothetical protein
VDKHAKALDAATGGTMQSDRARRLHQRLDELTS